MRRRAALSLLLVAVVGLVACNGGGGSEIVTTTAPPTASVTIGPPSPIVALTDGCHRTRGGAVELLVRFNLESSPLLGLLHEGEKLGFRGTIVDPSTWSTTGQAPKVTVHPSSYINHILIPGTEPLPPLLTFHVDVFLERRVAVTATGLDQLSGKTAHGPFGDFAISQAARQGSDVVLTMSPQGGSSIPSGFAQVGPRSATLTIAGKAVPGRITTPESSSSPTEFRFHATAASGSATLSLGDWTLSAAGLSSYTGTPGACGNV